MATSADVNKDNVNKNKKDGKKSVKVPTSVTLFATPESNAASIMTSQTNPGIKFIMSQPSSQPSSFMFQTGRPPQTPFGNIRSPQVQVQHPQPVYYTDPQLSSKIDTVISKLSKLELIEEQQS